MLIVHLVESGVVRGAVAGQQTPYSIRSTLLLSAVTNGFATTNANRLFSSLNLALQPPLHACVLADAHPFSYMVDMELEWKRFDPQGHYVRRWLPVLSQLPNEYIHQPWKAPPEVLEEAGEEIAGGDWWCCWHCHGLCFSCMVLGTHTHLSLWVRLGVLTVLVVHNSSPTSKPCVPCKRGAW